MSKSKRFERWFVDALEDLSRMQRELNDAKCGLEDAAEAWRRWNARQPRGAGDKLLRGKIKYAILRYQTDYDRYRLRLLFDKCETCVRLQRERIVQAWHRHVQRSLKKCAGYSDEYIRAEWRRIAGLYAVFCMVDDYDIVRGNPYIGYVYDETTKRIAKES